LSWWELFVNGIHVIDSEHPGLQSSAFTYIINQLAIGHRKSTIIHADGQFSLAPLCTWNIDW